MVVERLEERMVLASWTLNFLDAGAPPNQTIYGDVRTDDAGNMLIAGRFRGTVDFDPGASVSNLTSAGGDNVFVAKYSPDGVLHWAMQFGGSGNDKAIGLDLDSAGNTNPQGIADPPAPRSELVPAITTAAVPSDTLRIAALRAARSVNQSLPASSGDAEGNRLVSSRRAALAAQLVDVVFGNPRGIIADDSLDSRATSATPVRRQNLNEIDLVSDEIDASIALISQE